MQRQSKVAVQSKASSKVGSNPLQRGGSSAADGSGQASTNVCPFNGDGLHVLNNQLCSRTVLELGMVKESDRAMMSMIDTEDKMLQCISDLWMIVKAQPRYQKQKERSWKADDSPMDIIVYLLRKLGPLAKGNFWTIDTWMDGRIMRYRFIIIQAYKKNDVRPGEWSLALDFLPLLAFKDKSLHDLLVDTFALMSKHCHIPLWNKDGDYSRALEELKKEKMSKDLQRSVLGHEKAERYARQKKIYTTGVAAAYLKLIKQRSNNALASDIYHGLRRYKGKSHRQNWITRLISSAAECINRGGGNLKDFSCTPNYTGAKGSATEAFRLYKFIWSNHHADIVTSTANQLIDADDKKYHGSYVPVEYSIIYPGKKAVMPKDRYFPISLHSWFYYMNSHFSMKPHRMYYFRNQDEKDITLSEEAILNPIKPKKKK